MEALRDERQDVWYYSMVRHKGTLDMVTVT